MTSITKQCIVTQPKVKCKVCNVAIKEVARHFRQMSCIQTYYEELGVNIEIEESDKMCSLL